MIEILAWTNDTYNNVLVGKTQLHGYSLQGFNLYTMATWLLPSEPQFTAVFLGRCGDLIYFQLNYIQTATFISVKVLSLQWWLRRQMFFFYHGSWSTQQPQWWSSGEVICGWIEGELELLGTSSCSNSPIRDKMLKAKFAITLEHASIFASPTCCSIQHQRCLRLRIVT